MILIYLIEYINLLGELSVVVCISLIEMYHVVEKNMGGFEFDDLIILIVRKTRSIFI